MNYLPDTSKTAGRRSAGPVLAAAGFAVLLLAVVLSLVPDDFSPGEELVSPGVEDIAASPEDTTYPGSDALRFDDGPEVVYVYLRVEDLAKDGDLGARVERASKTSALGRLFGGGGLRVVDEDEDRLGVSGGGVSGVVKFAVRPASGGRLPPGNYTVEVYDASGGAGAGDVVARKYFVVGD